MSTNKEPMCFARPRWEDRVAGYRALFERHAPVRGESSTAYSSFPWAPETADRVKATVADARIIYLVRDPVPRTLSHYAQNVWDEREWASFDILMTDLEHPMNMPVWCSRYATQLERWIDRFGGDQVLVIDHRELMEERRAILQRVFEFLGVDPEFISPDWDAEYNVGEEHRVPTHAASRLGRLGAAAMRAPALRHRLTRPVAKPTLTDDQRARLCEFLAPEVARLRELTGMAFADWSI
jgi:Sulfotransferase family